MHEFKALFTDFDIYVDRQVTQKLDDPLLFLGCFRIQRLMRYQPVISVPKFFISVQTEKSRLFRSVFFISYGAKHHVLMIAKQHPDVRSFHNLKQQIDSARVPVYNIAENV